jgi:hypothetical protein
LIHEVCGCRTLMYFTDFVNLACQHQDSFGGGGFASIYVCEDANISIAGKVFHNDWIKLNATNSGNPQGDRTPIHHIWYMAIFPSVN